MSKDPLIYIGHIADCIAQIKEYTEGLEQDDFLKSRLIQDAVIRNFEVIGEATKNLNADFRKKYSEISWKEIAGMRDKIIHDYIGVDLWAVVEDVIPEFEQQVRIILNKEKSNKNRTRN